MAATRALVQGRRQAAVLFSAGRFLGGRASPPSGMFLGARGEAAVAGAWKGKDKRAAPPSGMFLGARGDAAVAGAWKGKDKAAARFIVQPHFDSCAGGISGGVLGTRRFNMARMMSSGCGEGAGAGTGKEVAVISSGGSASGGSGGSAAEGISAGAATGGCKCAEQVARLREDTMAEIQRLWFFSSGLMDQYGEVLKENSDLKLMLATQDVKHITAVTHLSYSIVFSGITGLFAIVTFVGPYVKQQWQADTVDEVFTKLEKMEMKRKDGEEATSKAKAVEGESPMKKAEQQVVNLKTVKDHNDGASSHESPKKRWWFF